MTNLITKQTILDALPGGFSADWTQDFHGDSELYYMNGSDDTSALDSMDEKARAAAEAYWHDVNGSIEEAREHELRCAECLRSDDIEGALKAIEAAAGCESAWGDDPTYSVITEMIAILARFHRAWS